VGAVSEASPEDALMRRAAVIPILTIEDAANAVPLARALVAGGLPVMEVTLRTPAALEAIRRIVGEVPDAELGAGTILTPADFEAALKAGARFVVTPGLTERLLRAMAGAPVPLLPGVATASEVMRALDAGMTHLKFFPAEAVGGAPAIAALAGPFGQARFCPTGGINARNAPSYFALPNVLCVGGAWVAPPDAIRDGDWDRITGLAREAAALRG